MEKKYTVTHTDLYYNVVDNEGNIVNSFNEMSDDYAITNAINAARELNERDAKNA